MPVRIQPWVAFCLCSVSVPAAAARRRSTLSGALAALLLPLAVGAVVSTLPVAAGAQVLGAKVTVDELEQLLQPGPATRGFRMTRPPDTSTQLCEQVPGKHGTASPGADNVTAAARNLEVVPYGGDDSPAVQLAVRFANDSDALTAPDKALLDKLAQAVNRESLRQARFAVAGHTDRSGSDVRNLRLSCARARAAVKYLIGQGVDAARMSAYGFGSARPLRAGMAEVAPENRRVEIRAQP